MNFDLLSALKDSTNALVAMEIDTKTIVAGNPLAREFFGQEDGTFQFEKLMGDAESQEAFVQGIKNTLEEGDNAVVEDTIVYGSDGKKIECDLTFGYLTRERTHVFIRVRPSVNYRLQILENFIATRKRPCFTLNVYDNFRIVHANEEFYKTFASSKESMKEHYDNQFLMLLSEAQREDYESALFKALIERTADVLPISVQAANGRILWFYYDMQRLNLVESDWNANLFCMLVRKGETVEDLCRIGNT